MQNKQSFLNLLGLAHRAGKLITGESAVSTSLTKKQVYLVLIANDASIRTKDKFSRKSFFYNVQIIDDLSCEELSKSIGKPMRKIIAVADYGFAQALIKLKRGDEDEG